MFSTETLWEGFGIIALWLGIPAIVHEECLTGLAAWGAASFPTSLAWGATFDPERLWDLAERERVLGLPVVGDAMARVLEANAFDGGFVQTNA